MPSMPVVLAGVAVVAGCGATSACEPLDGPPPRVEEDVEGRVIPEPDDEAAFLFDRTVLRTVELEIAPEDLAALDAAPADEDAVPGTFALDGERVGPVAIRYKGSLGSWMGCVSGSPNAHAWMTWGHKTCPKLSFKIDFHALDDDLRFHGLKKLELHAMNRDPSLLREQLALALFRQAGVPAPRTAHVRVVVNGVLEGVFLLSEAVDGRFTDVHFADGDGNLYKEAWPTSIDGYTVAPDEATLRAALETNEGATTDVSRMLGIGRAVQDATGLDRLRAVAAGFGVEHTARYLAVDRTIANDDGAVHFYCGREKCWNHNFYVYEDAHADRLWLIPWDLDLSFVTEGPAATSTDGAVALTVPWDAPHARCVEHRGGADDALDQVPAACDPLLNAMACGFHDPYDDAVDAFLEGPFRADAVEAELDAWASLVADAVQEAHDADPRQLSPEDWAVGLEDLRRRIDVLRARAGRR